MPQFAKQADQHRATMPPGSVVEGAHINEWAATALKLVFLSVSYASSGLLATKCLNSYTSQPARLRAYLVPDLHLHLHYLYRLSSVYLGILCTPY